MVRSATGALLVSGAGANDFQPTSASAATPIPSHMLWGPKKPSFCAMPCFPSAQSPSNLPTTAAVASPASIGAEWPAPPTMCTRPAGEGKPFA